jgi:hypothetical protein
LAVVLKNRWQDTKAAIDAGFVKVAKVTGAGIAGGHDMGLLERGLGA